MILRPRQERFVKASLDALKEHDAVLGVAPTGAGKTVMLSAVATRFKSVLVLQHRDELIRQNARTFRRFPGAPQIGIVDADSKAFASPATFASVATLCLPGSLARMKPCDLVVIDEAHHAPAASYRKILERARQLNPGVKFYGVTATPNRGDRAGLGQVFNHVADQITIHELIASGHLVPPVCYVIDVGISAGLDKVKRTRSGEYDMNEVEALMNTEVVFDEIIRHWREKAGDRQTVVFAPTVDYAHAFADHLTAQGVKAETVDGTMPGYERQRILRDVEAGRTQVLVNVMVATEGWDCPPVSCVVLLRPSSYKSTMMQMIGRGLRTLNPVDHPGLVKTDCIVLDFGRSLLKHQKNLFDPFKLSEGKHVTCDGCKAVLPPASLECPLCGATIHVPEELELDEDEAQEKDVDKLHTVKMVRIDPLAIQAESPFRWHIRPRSGAKIATGFGPSVMVFRFGGAWHACALEPVKSDDMVHKRVVKLYDGEEGPAVAAADDYMRDKADPDQVGKRKRWLTEPMSDKQREILKLGPLDFSLNRYQASCEIELLFHETKIRRAYGMPAK